MVRNLALFLLGLFPVLAQSPGSDISGFVELNGALVPYRDVDGNAIIWGDVSVGRTHEVTAKAGAQTRGSAVVDAPKRWTNGIIPYVIDPSVPPEAISLFHQARAEWEAVTPVRFRPRSGEANYFRLVAQPSGGCFSGVGMQGPDQSLNLPATCGIAAARHELGHTIGLWHTQQRADRDQYLEIDDSELELASGAWQRVVDQVSDIGPYDFASIMHYPVFPGTYSRRGASPIRSRPAGILFDGNTVIRPSDIDIVKRMYGVQPQSTTLTSNPVGLQLEVDGKLVKTPQTFDWAPGSRHLVRVPSPQDLSPDRYIFARWSPDGLRDQEIIAGPETTIYIANFSRRCHVDFESPASGGSYSVSPYVEDGYYPCDAELKLSATPENGYSLYRWSTNPTEPSLTPLYLRPLYSRGFNPIFLQGPVFEIRTTPDQLSSSKIDPPRSIRVDGVRIPTPQRFQWSSGSQHSVSAVNHSLGQIQMTFADWSDKGPSTHTVTMGANSNQITAQFHQRYQVIAFTYNGTVNLSPPSSDSYYDHGTLVTFTWQPSIPNPLSGWQGILQGTANPQTVAITGPSIAVAAGAPVATQPRVIEPSTVVAGSGAFSLYVSGDRRILGVYGYPEDPNLKLLWNGVPRAFEVVANGAALRTVVRPEEIATPGVVQIQFRGSVGISGSLNLTIASPPPGCTISLGKQTLSLPAAGGVEGVQVSAPANCPWFVQSFPDWIEPIPQTTPTGTGILSFMAAPNSSSKPRTASIQVGSQNLSVTQDPVTCKYSLAQDFIPIGAAGGDLTLRFFNPSEECSWTVAKDDDWLRFTSPTSGTSSGRIQLRIEANPGNRRTATIKIGNERVTIVQSGLGDSQITSVNVVGGGDQISANSWIEIKGSRIVPAATPPEGVIWSNAPEFRDGQMPITLGGVSVTINNKPAYIYYFCSAITSTVCPNDQVNVLTPIDGRIGPVTVVVRNGAQSTSYVVPQVARTPALLKFDAAGHVAGTHINGTFLGPTSLYPGKSFPARAGEAISIFGTGFGLPSSTLTPGAATQAGLFLPTTCTVGGVAAQGHFSGLVSPGLAQINLTVPAGISGDLPIACDIVGSATTFNPVLTVAP